MAGTLLRGGFLAGQGTLDTGHAHRLVIPARPAGKTHEGPAALAGAHRLHPRMHGAASAGVVGPETTRQLRPLIQRHPAKRTTAADRFRVAPEELTAVTAFQHTNSSIPARTPPARRSG